MREFVTHKQWDDFVNRIVRANIKMHGQSLSATSMRGGDLIIEIHDDRKGMIVSSDWRSEMRRRYLKPGRTTNE